jgi:hypothetical protein
VGAIINTARVSQLRGCCVAGQGVVA